MGRWKCIHLSLKAYIRCLDPNPRPGRSGHHDIRVNLCNWHCQGGPPIHDGVLAKENDLAGRRGFHLER